MELLNSVHVTYSSRVPDLKNVFTTDAIVNAKLNIYPFVK